MVVLVSDGVSDYAKKLLEADGWIVENISLLVNPNQVRPKSVSLLEFACAVVYLDADTIVVKSIEDLFKCEKFCANLKHSERLNSGVMVVEPSEAVFNDMMSKVNTLPSYTGGDQGFLNSYYSGFPNSHVFDPNIPQEVLKVRPVPEMEQLSTLYNADVGLYMLANKNVRERLEETLIGTGGGKNPNDELLVKFLSCYLSVFLSFVTIVLFFSFLVQTGGSLFRTSLCNHIRHLYFIIRSSGTVAYSGVSSSSNINTKVPVYLGGISVFRGRRIVTQLTPVSADTDLFNSDPKKDHLQASSCDIVSWYYGLGMAFLVIVAPSLPCIFGITALFLRLGLMVVGGIILASFMTYASEHLAIRSFLKGCEDRDTTQSRECFLC
ncbi:hypothetical protein GOBAR_DD15210 [Gossypium barbadense]|nr:hypothetical protein GOBAR_DD15210 [Gossypium barbadense]